MNSFEKKIIISTTPINQRIWTEGMPETNAEDVRSTLEMKEHSDTSNKIFNGLMYSFELGADPKRFIVSSEIFKGESTLLRTNNAFIENFGQLDWVTNFQSANQWNDDPFPINKCGDALKLGVNKVGITILYNPNISYKDATLKNAIDSMNESIKLTHQKLIISLKIIHEESKENNDLMVLESIRQLQDADLNPDSWILELNGNEDTASLISSQAQIDDRLDTSVILKINDLEEMQKSLEVLASTIGIQGILLDFNVWEKFIQKLKNNTESTNFEQIIADKILEILKRLDYINSSMNF
jgi:hypothetical protein